MTLNPSDPPSTPTRKMSTSLTQVSLQFSPTNTETLTSDLLSQARISTSTSNSLQSMMAGIGGANQSSTCTCDLQQSTDLHSHTPTFDFKSPAACADSHATSHIQVFPEPSRPTRTLLPQTPILQSVLIGMGEITHLLVPKPSRPTLTHPLPTFFCNSP